MINFPKLRYPINATKGLTNEDRLILLAYDMLWKIKNLFKQSQSFYFPDQNMEQDLDANLANLGHHIEHVICGGDMALRFEGYDNPNMTDPIGVDIFPLGSELTSADMIKEFKTITEKELK